MMITVAPVGAEATRAQNPQLPLTPREIGEAVYAAFQEGAVIAHLHARDERGEPTQCGDTYRRVIDEVKRRCDIIIQVSTGGAVGMSWEERADSLRAAPEMATLTTGTVNFGEDVFHNPFDYMRRFAQRMHQLGITPEIEIFEVGMIANALRLVREGLLELPLHFDLVMGVPGGIPGTPEQLLHLVDTLPAGCTWTVAGIGRSELPLAVMAILCGGHARVGFEDNLYYSRGVLASSNAQLVARVARLAQELGRSLVSVDEARGILGLDTRQGKGPGPENSWGVRRAGCPC